MTDCIQSPLGSVVCRWAVIGLPILGCFVAITILGCCFWAVKRRRRIIEMRGGSHADPYGKCVALKVPHWTDEEESFVARQEWEEWWSVKPRCKKFHSD